MSFFSDLIEDRFDNRQSDRQTANGHSLLHACVKNMVFSLKSQNKEKKSEGIGWARKGGKRKTPGKAV